MRNTDRDVLKPGSADGAIAQLGERLNGIQEVVGSIPIGSTNKINNLGRQAGFLRHDLGTGDIKHVDLSAEGASF